MDSPPCHPRLCAGPRPTSGPHLPPYGDSLHQGPRSPVRSGQNDRERQKGQHMVQETHTCIDISFPVPSSSKGHCHVSFLRPAMDSTVSHDHPSRISFTASMMRAFSSKGPRRNPQGPRQQWMLGIISNQDLPGEEPLKRVFPAAFAMFSLPLARLLLFAKGQ